jgi:hypothetical protein
MEWESNIYKQSCIQKTRILYNEINQSGVITDPVSINRKETLQKEITGRIKNQEYYYKSNPS